MRRVAAIISAAVLIGSGLLLISGGAALASCNSTNHFCAWKDVDYNGSKLLDSGLGAGSRNVFQKEKDREFGEEFHGQQMVRCERTHLRAGRHDRGLESERSVV